MIRSHNGLTWIQPDWPAPVNVGAASTLRSGGVSTAPFNSLNLALHVNDDIEAVLENRHRVAEALHLPSEPCWLQQVHGTQIVSIKSYNEPPIADASFTTQPGQVCAVMTADCLPVLFCTYAGDRVAAAHAGWRGLVSGILESTVKALNVPGSSLMAWLGPAISQNKFEVGDEVMAAFTARNPKNIQCFTRNDNKRWQADIYALARLELQQLGVHDIFANVGCTVADASHFFSYRRDGQTGRMASMIWLQPQ